MEYRNDAFFDRLIKVSPISINVIDIETKELLCASNWTANHIGYTEEEFKDLSQNLFERIVHPEDRPNQLEAYTILLRDPTLYYKECKVRVLKKSGEYIFALLRMSILEVDLNNTPKTLLNTAIDITEMIKLQERLDAELRKMEIISYKNSHELRGPVATILGLIQLIDYEGLDGRHAYEIIQSLKSTVEKLDKVIKEINEHTY